MLNKIKLVLLLIAFPLLYGCSTVDNSRYFAEHERSYKAQTNYKTHYVNRNGLKIHVREYGKKSTQPSMVLMHGFPDSMHLYDWLVPELMNDEHIIAFDFIGWGDSDKPTNHAYNFASLIADLEAVVNRFRLDNMILVAHDASGPTGINWSLDNQDRVAGLVILNSVYNQMPTLVRPEAIETFSTPGLQQWISTRVSSSSDALWMRGYNQQMDRFISTKSLREPFKKILGHQALKIRPAFFGLNRVLQRHVESNNAKTKLLKSFKPPVRIIFGDDDPYLNRGVAKEFHRLYGDSELFLIKDAGHFVQVDKPKEVAGLIKELRMRTSK